MPATERSPLAIARIEFLGAPGAGKSSLYAEVMDELRLAGVEVVGIDDAVYDALRAEIRDRLVGPMVRHTPSRVGRRYYRHLVARSQDRVLALRGFFLEYPETVKAILDGIESRKEFDQRQDLALGWMLELLWKYQLAMAPRVTAECLVQDEGFANRAVSLFGYRFSADDEPNLRRYIASIPEPDLVIVVTADAETAASRNTGRVRFSHLTEAEAVEYTRDAIRCVEYTSRLLHERGVDVVEVKNDAPPSVVSGDVRQVVREWLDRES